MSLNIKTVLLFFVLVLSVNSCKNPTENSTNSKNENDEPNIEEITKKIEANDDNPDLYIQRAKLYQKEGNLNDAITDAQKACQLDNKKYENYLFLADLFLAANQVQGTISSLNAVLGVEPNHVEANLKMSELNLMFKRYDDAIKYANIVLETDVYNSKAHFLRGFTFKEYGDTTKAVTSFSEAVKQNPEYYEAYVELGIIFSAKKDPIAVEYFKNAINLGRPLVDAHYNLAMFYQENGFPDKAIEVYKNIIQLKPDYTFAYYNMGYIYLTFKGDPLTASNYFTKSIEFKPDYTEAYYNLGLCYEELKRYSEAQAALKNALKYTVNYEPAIEALNRIDEKLR